MSKNKNKKHIIPVEDKPLRKGHFPHRSGGGSHDSRPKRERTREKQREAWEEEFDEDFLIDNCIL